MYCRKWGPSNDEKENKKIEILATVLSYKFRVIGRTSTASSYNFLIYSQSKFQFCKIQKNYCLRNLYSIWS